MMKTVFTFIKWSSTIVITVLSLTAKAAELEASHTIVSSANDGMGLNTITLEMTITNNSPSDLIAVSLQLVPVPKVRITGTPQLEVSSLIVGAPTTVQWSLHTPLPAEIVAGTQPLMFTGEAQDASGAQVPVHLISAPVQ